MQQNHVALLAHIAYTVSRATVTEQDAYDAAGHLKGVSAIFGFHISPYFGTGTLHTKAGDNTNLVSFYTHAMHTNRRSC